MAVLLTGLLALILLRIAAAGLCRAGRTVHVQIRSQGSQITAVLNGEYEASISDSDKGSGIGIYAFLPEGCGRRPFYARNLVLTPADGPFRGIPQSLALTAAREYGRDISNSDGWRIVPGRGLTFQGGEGSRGTAMLNGLPARDFVLEVDFTDATDSGILLRARDKDNGIVFVVRPPLNDAYFFNLTNGIPGPILGLIPVSQLSAGREILELVNLLLEILLNAALFILLLKGLLWLIPRRELFQIRSGPGLRIVRVLIPIMLTVMTFSALAAVALRSLDGIPHIDDEQAYTFQAKIFAEGHLWAPVPAAKEFFEHWHIIMDGNRWFGKYPPLYPAILAMGMKLDRPWIINSLLGSITGLFIFLTAKKMRGYACGLTAWLLALTSPFYLIVGGSMMSHMTVALFTIMAVYFMLTVRDNECPGFFMLAGICMGLALLTRPYTALLVSFPVFLFAAYEADGWPSRGRGAQALLAFAAGMVPLVILSLCWNYAHLAGREFPLGLYKLYDATDTLGFGPLRGAGQRLTWGTWGHTPAKALRSLYAYLDHTSFFFLGWPRCLSLAFVLYGLAGVFRDRRKLLLAGIFIALMAGHFLYWATEHVGIGARYWFEAMPGFYVLAACGICRLTGGWRNCSGTSSAAGGITSHHVLVWLALLILVFMNATAYLPKRLKGLHNLNNITAQLKTIVTQTHLTNAVVFVQTSGLSENDGFFMNDPFMRSGLIFARDLGARNGELLAHYPGYRAYLWDHRELRELVPEKVKDE